MQNPGLTGFQAELRWNMNVGNTFSKGFALTALFLTTGTAINAEVASTVVSPDEALVQLKEGNASYVSGRLVHPDQDTKRRQEVAQSQHPFAIIVSCSDSRVPPEVVFDKGLGDLFVIRTAGEVVTDIELGSIEYGAEQLGAPLIVVLGHERCGAVQAALEGGEAPGNIQAIVDRIKPAVEQAKQQQGDKLENAIKNNAELVAKKIQSSEVIAKLIKEKKVKIVTAYYDLDDGTVKILH